jgi:malto-oligosyltrehalose synthase/4-alpha-glucanotransferase
MNPINSTYRFQFHKNFTLEHAERLTNYLNQLGVATLYASPIFEAVAGSTHGYDGIDPTKINPEVGDLDQLVKLSEKLRDKNIGWLQDIVPNHMAFHPSNRWLMDVLEKGERSMYAQFFDMSPVSKLFDGKVMVPFLAAGLEQEIEKGNIKIEADADKLYLKCGESVFPVNAESYLTLFQATDQSEKELFPDTIKQVLQLTQPKRFSQEWEKIKSQFRAAGGLDKLFQDVISKWNTDPERIKTLANQQFYTLCESSITEQKINFRRFFTVNDLLCLNIQNKPVFDACHSLIEGLLQEGVFTGLRIDHIDGLYDPQEYLQRLRAIAGEDTYITVEKILENDEQLPVNWPVEGTSGYDFLAQVNQLFTNTKAEKTFTEFYQKITDSKQRASEILLEKKRLILYEQMGGEYENLFQLIFKLNLADADTMEKAGAEDLKKILGEFLVYFPVYRFYGSSFPLGSDEYSAVAEIFTSLKDAYPGLLNAAELLQNIMLTRPDGSDDSYRERVQEFYQRCMQFSGPLMAKGVEDTLMYTYNRFIGLNDVGGSVESFGKSPKDFHRKMQLRQKLWPLTMNTTSTHDTKRGEDVRARLNVLTDLADLWNEKVEEWFAFSGNPEAPDRNDQYLIYQTIAGAYPMPGEGDDDFAKRLSAYLEKALREAKRKTTWTDPDENYEKASQEFVTQLLDKKGKFWQSYTPFHSKIADYGITNSIAQLILKFTCPGIPDVYQGTELWDLSLVDPDNRRPVDYQLREQILEDFRQIDAKALPATLWKNRNNGHIKLWITQQLFNQRKENPEFYQHADYFPLEIKGTLKEHVFAFYRVHRNQVMLIAVPLNTASICEKQQTDILNLDWQQTEIVLPDFLGKNWRNILTSDELSFEKNIQVDQLLRNLPAALLKGTQPADDRRAGVLAHITSLPSAFGIGDLGPEAYRFADFLYQGYQKVWQMLPVNPLDSAQGFSPYSALSSMAAEPMLISPELLREQGLLTEEDLQLYELQPGSCTDYLTVQHNKNQLLRSAYRHFNEQESQSSPAFEAFRKHHADWLQDYSLFVTLRGKFENKPWTEWDEQFRSRQPEAMNRFAENYQDEIRFHQWVQFVFRKQWEDLRAYCNEHDITLFGDLPFYVGADSSDVWAHQDLFMLDEKGNITSKAGVPPDVFSDTGQLWGMPVFNWEAHKKDNYEWWINRLRRNTEIYDLVRLDHFRAFADYWAVEGKEKTAEKGEWLPGPGEDFFEAVGSALGKLPFVAEDLGEISQDVFALRDQFKLPGMKVLQFAFGQDIAKSLHVPHHHEVNFIVYTGTHDNNTSIGWLKEQQESDPLVIDNLCRYFNQEVNENNINKLLIAAAYGSTAQTAILPLQDILELDEQSRLNSPGSEQGNWQWRVLPEQLTGSVQTRLRELVKLYGRI